MSQRRKWSSRSPEAIAPTLHRRRRLHRAMDCAADQVARSISGRDAAGGGHLWVGASGRNGGFATSWWQKLSSLIETYGEEEGMRLARESAAAVAAIGRVCADYGIDADFRPGGVLIPLRR